MTAPLLAIATITFAQIGMHLGRKDNAYGNRIVPTLWSFALGVAACAVVYFQVPVAVLGYLFGFSMGQAFFMFLKAAK